MSLGIRTVLLLIFGMMAAANTFAQKAPPNVGAILKDLKGTLSVQNGNNPPQPSKPGVPIPVGAVVQTGNDSGATLIFADRQTCTLGENSTFRVASQACDPVNPAKNEMSINLMSGSMRCVTGSIGKSNPSALRMQLGVVTLGADTANPSRADVSAVVQGGTAAVTVEGGSMVAFLPSGVPLQITAGQGLVLGQNGAVTRGTAAQIVQQASALPQGPKMKQQFAALQGDSQNIAQTEAALASPASAQQLSALFECLPPPGDIALPVIAAATTPPTGAAGGGLPCTASCN